MNARKSVSVVWLRNDLRLHDNAALYHAQMDSMSSFLFPVYCLDPRQLDIDFVEGASEEPTKPNTFIPQLPFPKCGSFRSKFLAESLLDVKKQLKERDSDLVIVKGKPEQALPDFFQYLTSQGFHIDALHFQKEYASEETGVEKRLGHHLKSLYPSLAWRGYWSATLYHPDDINPDNNLPLYRYTDFRKYVESDQFNVRPCLTLPNTLKPLPLDMTSSSSTLQSILVQRPIRLPQVQSDPRGLQLSGGETQALLRLKSYFFDTDAIAKYKETRNGTIGADYSSKFSLYLAHGCLSPRWIYHELKRYETERIANTSTYWLTFELLWRDFFKFLSQKEGDAFFRLEGLIGVKAAKDLPELQRWMKETPETMMRFERWRLGRTGVPWVDAGMRELLKTGYLSNRLRQNVASFLTKSLGIDWRYGAAWFESILIDHDVSVNYGNWQYVAGVGVDPRESRKFNMVKQALDYDPQAEYIKLWVPELQGLDLPNVFTPWTLPANVLESIHYFQPILIEPEWKRHGTRLQNSAGAKPQRRRQKKT